MRPFSNKTAERLIRWYLAQPETERMECHVLQRHCLNMVANDARKAGLKSNLDGRLSYQAFLMGIDKRSRLQTNRKLRSTDDLEAVTETRIAAMKATNKAKPSPKLDRLQGDLAPVVQKLKSEGLSWQKVSYFLARYHKISCCRGYLQKVFANMPFE